MSRGGIKAVADGLSKSIDRVRIIQTIAGVQSQHGGTSRSVPALCESLAEIPGNHVTLLTTSAPEGDHNCLPGSPVESIEIPRSRFFGRILLSRAFADSLGRLASRDKSSTAKATVVHDHGIWLSSNHGVAKFCRKRQVIRVVSPRGMLSEWSINRGRLKKKLAWAAFQHHDLRTATAFHVTSELERTEVRALGFRQPVAVIPNGIVLPEAMPEWQRDAGRKTILFLSRIHPKKGLVELVQAWAAAKPGPEWRLLLVGPDEGGYADAVQRQINQEGVAESVQIQPAVSNDEKWNLYRRADIFVLPSFSENFGLVVAEAMAAGLPVITSTGTPWEEVRNQNCGWWIPPTNESLTSVLRTVFRTPKETLEQMGKRAQDWVRKQYQWQSVALRMHEFYEFLQHSRFSNRHSVPDFVDATASVAGEQI